MGKEPAPNPPKGPMLTLGPPAVRAIAYAACSAQSHIGIGSSIGAFRAHICQVALLVMRKTANVNMVTIQQSRSFRLESMIPSSLQQGHRATLHLLSSRQDGLWEKPYKWKDNSSKRYHHHFWDASLSPWVCCFRLSQSKKASEKINKMLLILLPFHVWACWGRLICKTVLFVEFNACPWSRQQRVRWSLSDKGALLCPWMRQWEERTYTNILKDLDQLCWLFTKPKASVLTVVILQKCAQNRWFRPVYRMIYRVIQNPLSGLAD